MREQSLWPPDSAPHPGRPSPSGPSDHGRRRWSDRPGPVLQLAVEPPSARALRPSRPYRLLLTTWQDIAAGSIQSVQYLAEGLLARGHNVRVACPPDGVLGRRLCANRVPLVPLEFADGWSLRSARAIARIVREHDIELVDAQESRDRKAAVLARWFYRHPARLVVTRRQMTATLAVVNRVYSLSADRIVAISRGVASDLVEHGVQAGKISVVHTGLDPRRVSGPVLPGEVMALVQELRLDPALPTVGVVARRKDQETLLRALVDFGRAVNVVFAGIERDAALAMLERALPDGTRVAYTGFRDRILPVYALLDVMVLTTRREGLSQAILESLALGVPVITAAVGGTPEVVRHGENGLHYPPGDAAALARMLARMLDDHELRNRMADAGRHTAGGPFHADRLVLETEAVYRELLEGG